jgi:hypothetical protein
VLVERVDELLDQIGFSNRHSCFLG